MYLKWDEACHVQNADQRTFIQIDYDNLRESSWSVMPRTIGYNWIAYMTYSITIIEKILLNQQNSTSKFFLLFFKGGCSTVNGSRGYSSINLIALWLDERGGRPPISMTSRDSASIRRRASLTALTLEFVSAVAVRSNACYCWRAVFTGLLYASYQACCTTYQEFRLQAWLLQRHLRILLDFTRSCSRILRGHSYA